MIRINMPEDMPRFRTRPGFPELFNAVAKRHEKDTAEKLEKYIIQKASEIEKLKGWKVLNAYISLFAVLAIYRIKRFKTKEIPKKRFDTFIKELIKIEERFGPNLKKAGEVCRIHLAAFIHVLTPTLTLEYEGQRKKSFKARKKKPPKRNMRRRRPL